MDYLKLRVNGVEYKVGSDVNSDDMLLDYLRNYLQLRGTKYMCREGGCGSCIVTAAKTPGAPYVAVNSCLVSIGSCHGWDIRTIEGLGNKKDGYHELQTTLAECHGSQCGYCSPGWVMAMHGLMESKKNVTMLEVEQSFGSNLCRCTGYRPIMTAFKKFATDAPKEERIMKIKNLNISKTSFQCCKSRCDDEDDWCVVRDDEMYEERMKKIRLKDGKMWYRPNALSDVLKLLKENSESYMLVGGNTAKGVSPIDEYPKDLIDISCLQELKGHELDQNLIIGAGSTLTEFMDILKTMSQQEYFSYLDKCHTHVDLVAHIPIRNVATVAGNLMIKHTTNSFQSDIYLVLNTVGAQLTIVNYNSVTEVVTMEEFLKISMKGKVIVNVMLPPRCNDYLLYTYKLMGRAQSSHAIVNMGFSCKIDSATNLVQEAKIVYGALSVNFPRATATETYLVGKSLFTNDTLQGALKVLDGEMIVDENPPEPSADYKRHVAKAIFFKGLLTLCPSTTVGTRFASGTINLHESRPCSTAKQTFDSDTTKWPLNEPVMKLEAKVQCAGEARYTDDIPSMHNEVFAAFVLSSVAVGTITKIDASDALKLQGVLAFLTAEDIPGLNSFTPADGSFTTSNEEVFCSGNVKYYYQAIGLIVAETQHLADRASKLVKVEYSNQSTAVTNIKVAKEDSSRNTLYTSVDATSTGTDVYKIITGNSTIHGQYHFPMETIVCVAMPTEEGLEVHASSQWPDGVQMMISRALNLDENKIDVYVRRVGGGYGMKISRCVQSAVACSLVVQKLNRPCRLIQPITTNLKVVGKRMAHSIDYEVAVNSSGVVQYVNETTYTDNGYLVNEPAIVYGTDVYFNCYDVAKFNYKCYNTITDTASNTFCRAPGTLEAIGGAETIMEHISYELSLDPLAVRLANLDTTNYGTLTEMVESIKSSADFTTRRAAVDNYNAQNRWKKRGLRWSFSRWPPAGGVYVDVNISIFHTDCSIMITHGGVEMGQGLNTKVAQVAAYLLQVPLSKIQIKGNSTISTPNSYVTGGSITTEAIIIALRRCVEEYTAKMEPVKATLTNPTFDELITAAYAANVDLQFHGHVSSSDAQSYNIYGIALAEVEVDILTGEFQILRVDILQDVGFSLSPQIDVGQVEGAFMMGVGYWTCEKLEYDSSTGAILTDRTWDYHVAEVKDTPQDFRITLKPNSTSNELILGSKGVGEPGICLSIAVVFAIKECIAHAMQETGVSCTDKFIINGPCSNEHVCMSALTKTEHFTFC